MSKKGAKNSKFRRNNPKRGGPGILVLTETGREGKGRREALDILRYYFYGSDQDKNLCSIKRNGDNDNNSDEHNQPDRKNEARRSLTLEEEIALLKKGVSADAVLQNHPGDPGGTGTRGNSYSYNKDGNGSGNGKGSSHPFGIYETGCKGTVSILHTLPKCELIAIPVIKKDNGDEGGRGDDRYGQDQDNKIDHHEEISSYDAQHKRKRNEVENTKKSCKSTSTPISKKKKECNDGVKDDTKNDNYSKSEDNNNHDDDASNPDPKWDPIQTVQAILHDIRVQNVKAPRSRFVTRMVPIQVTCFASMEEIEAHAKELVKKYFLPYGIQRHEAIKCERIETDHDGGGNGKMESQEAGNSLPSFKIEFKKRNCSHIQREAVVDCIANIVQELSSEYWKDKNENDASKENDTSCNNGDEGNEGGDGSSNSAASKALFRVDLKNPDYSIVVELCRTLCGMTIVADPGSFRNFNLMKVQEESQTV